jgi:hypothetical protein
VIYIRVIYIRVIHIRVIHMQMIHMRVTLPCHHLLPDHGRRRGELEDANLGTA